MRTQRVTSTYPTGRTKPASPTAPLGFVAGRYNTVEVIAVPDHVTPGEVARLWDQTTDVSWVYGAPLTRIRYEALGLGKMVGKPVSGDA